MIKNLSNKYMSEHPEIDILLCCTKNNEANKEKLASSLNYKIDWDYLISIACTNKMLPLLYSNINSVCPRMIPEKYLQYLRDHCSKSIRSNLFLSQELLNLISLFQNEKILVIPIKGPILTNIIYGNLALRESSDLDFLIHKHDFYKIKELLIQKGYKPRIYLNKNDEKNFLKYHYQLEFENPEGVNVDIHWNIAPKHLAVFNSKFLNNLWDSLIEIEFGNKRIKVLPKEELILLLSVHGAKDLWRELKLIADINELIQDPNLNWKKVLYLAKSSNLNRTFYLSVALASTLYQTLLPATITGNINKNPNIKELVNDVCNHIFRNKIKGLEVKEQFFFYLKLIGGFPNKLLFIFYFLIAPNTGDLMFIPLPNYLSFLHFIIRPFRLFGKYGFGLFRSRRVAAFIPTNIEIADEMLALANISKNDVLYDIGCGDGRIVTRAAKKFSIHCTGIDIDLVRINEAKINARKEGVENLTTFINEDLFKVNISSATIVIIYLPKSSSNLVKSKLDKELKPGTLVVTHGDIYFNNLTPIKTKIVPDKSNFIHTIRLWQIGTKTSTYNSKELAYSSNQK